MRHRISPAAVISLIALFFSVSGAGYAADRYVLTSTRQIKPSVLRALRGHNGRRGPAGIPGAQGPSGAAGATGAAGAGLNGAQVKQISQNTELTTANPTATITVNCPAGDTILNGGYLVPSDVSVTQSEATLAFAAPGWTVTARLNGESPTETVQVRIDCIPTS